MAPNRAKHIIFLVGQEKFLRIFCTKYLRIACIQFARSNIIVSENFNLCAFILSAEMWTVLATRHWSAVQRHCSESHFCQWAHGLHSQDIRNLQGKGGFIILICYYKHLFKYLNICLNIFL